MKAREVRELRRFVGLVNDHPLYTAFYVKANTGIRRGELFGLTWRVVDFDHARLSVTQTVTAPDYKIVVSDVKSAHALHTAEAWEKASRTDAPRLQFPPARPGPAGIPFR